MVEKYGVIVNPDGTIYRMNPANSEYDVKLPVVAHTHSDFSVDITEDHIRIIHIKIVNGLITELVTD
ncbi:hypothetical protein LCGC14_2169180 [marine sediment metagenome]|uniref:Uncharacterized protein n=1 Tax=marine sediment metagenome TaxID=412755 RepID=A0A0F9DQF5_9ZZZZ